jgi:hypothetical protein
VGINGQSSDEAIAALGGWAAAAPHSAKEWLEALPDSKSKETLVCGLLDGWSTVDFRAAAAYAESRPSSPAQDKFRELLLQRALRSGGIAAAQSWVVGMSEDDQNRDYKKRAFGDVIQAMLYRDPASAVRWISELEGQAYVGNEAVTGTAMKLAESSPVDALSWLTTLNLADANSAGRSAGAVLQNWAQMNPEAAGNWLQQNARHPFYDQMTASYARTVASTDPNAANEWLQTISNAQLREETLASLDQRNTATIRFATYEDTYSTFITELTRLDNVNTLALSGSVSPVEVESAPVLRAQLDSPHEVTTKGNPHGTEAKWKNCASCHKR